MYILGPIEIPANISPRRRALVNRLNDISKDYAEKEFKFISGGCKDEDHLHIETVKNYWLGLQAAFKESSVVNNRKIKQPVTTDISFRRRSFDYTCAKCGKLFVKTNYYNVQKHNESHERTEKQKSIVDTRTDSVDSVKMKKTAKKVFNYTCDICGKFFENMNKHNLKRHIERHERSQEGLTKHRKANYKCCSCKKYFEEIEHLANHKCETLRKDKRTGT